MHNKMTFVEHFNCWEFSMKNPVPKNTRMDSRGRKERQGEYVDTRLVFDINRRNGFGLTEKSTQVGVRQSTGLRPYTIYFGFSDLRTDSLNGN